MTRESILRRRHTVIVTLHSPREKIWGILLAIRPEGLWLHGIDLHSFDDWTRQITDPATGFGVIDMSTMFFPMHRIERIIIDEPAGSVASLAEQFRNRVGREIFDWIDWKKLEDLLADLR